MSFANQFRAGLMGPAHVTMLERMVTSAAGAPTQADDSSQGYFTGCRWYRHNGQEYVCRDAMPGAARWALVTYASTSDPTPIPGDPDPNDPPGPPPTGTLTGGFTTLGNQILDGAGNKIRFTGVNLTGFAGPEYLINGMFARPFRQQLQQIKQLGFNCIRLPFSDEAIRTTTRFTSVPGPNSDVVGKTPLEFCDMIVDECDRIGLYVLFDHHHCNAEGPHSNGEWGMQRNGLWYETRSETFRLYSSEEVIQSWVTLASRYRGRGIVIGADLHNEPGAQVAENPTRGAAWGGGDPAHDWPLWVERCAEEILTVNPDWLIVVEGIEWATTPFGPWYNPGANLAAYDSRPITLRRRVNGQAVVVTNKLVLSVHPYGPELAANYHRFEAGEGFPDSLPETWEGIWADKFWDGTAPIIVGEFGCRRDDGNTAAVTYNDRLLKYLSGVRDPSGNTNVLTNGDQGMGWFVWEWCDYSGDTGGIVQTADFTTVNTVRYNPLVPHLFGGAIVKPVAGANAGDPPTLPADTPVYTTTYYVDPTGNDANAGTSAAAPWATLAKVSATAIAAGAAVLFKRGNTWNGTLTIPGGGAVNNPVTYGAYGTGVAPIINANGAAQAVSWASRNHVTVRDLDLRGGTGSVVLISSATTGATVRGCRVSGGADGIIISGTSADTTIDGNVIENNTGYGIVHYHRNNTNQQILNNQIRYNGSGTGAPAGWNGFIQSGRIAGNRIIANGLGGTNGLCHGLYHGDQQANSTLVIENNTISGHTRGAGILAKSSTVIRNNVCQGNNAAGISVGQNVGVNVVFTLAGNVVTNNTADGILAHQKGAGDMTVTLSRNTVGYNGNHQINVGSNMTSLTVRDNILIGASTFRSATAQSVFSCNWNLHWNPSGAISCSLNGTSYTFASWRSSGRDQNGVNANPLLSNPTGSDYSLQPSSPAISSASDAGNMGAAPAAGVGGGSGTVVAANNFDANAQPFVSINGSAVGVAGGVMTLTQAAGAGLASANAAILNLVAGATYDLRISLRAAASQTVTARVLNGADGAELATQSHATTTMTPYTLRFQAPAGGAIDVRLAASSTAQWTADAFGITRV